ncbi:Hypothetical protein GbCGDNIH1_5094 [Granulibacter bethesdensis CGDNIH1]|uniref:Uncharacterized protein n=1 Tax=Granulibacter bethesdensis (strain ATCC BAA-1260 / CGDNIH1) TaxID=391165 RepID=A0A286M2Z6_GRABC|nr:Hypothetical protein GbCGDNIH5_5094 [Granulibacter bethesdensis]APH64380.1 Hypothetical protein GbCGDNIH1I4_5094 [Granulibacter bethesdensis]ASV62395.1 Hypothetical protein GbCGDNIH1_5094 [Granulibacter bethesdensis CGDNIH1]
MPLREPISNQNRPDILSSIRRFILLTEQLWQEKDKGYPLSGYKAVRLTTHFYDNLANPVASCHW